jgi:predicted TIM-barrel fold metal-dependent hydrolase
MTTKTLNRAETPESSLDPVEVTVIDTDVHVEPRSFEELMEYIDAPWRDRAIKGRVPFRRAGFTTFDVAGRMDAYPETGDLGSDPDLVEKHLFLDDPIDYAILLPWSLRGFTVDPALDTALAGAVNRWLAETWLSKYNTANRYVGSISVSVEDPVGAVREIEKWADHPGFRQVAISHYGPRPFGHPMYDQIWEAAARHQLPVSIHFKGGGNAASRLDIDGPAAVLRRVSLVDRADGLRDAHGELHLQRCSRPASGAEVPFP